MLAVQLVSVWLWPDCVIGESCEFKKNQEQIVDAIIRKRMPPLKAFADHADFRFRGLNLIPEECDCVSAFLETFEGHIGANMTTDPSIIAKIVEAMHLPSRDPLFVELLGDLLTSPMNLEKEVVDTAACARENIPLNALLCTFLDDLSTVPFFTTFSVERIQHVLLFHFHAWAVLERIGSQGAKSRELRVRLSSLYGLMYQH
jgi:hypothetical protein